MVVQQAGGLPWTVSTPGDAFTLTYTGSGKALDVNDFSSAEGLQLQQWSGNDGNNQQWQLVPA
ncbi:RICIN domain-containing protein [Amycolatopsis sp. DG1A-15b]|uniref:RICIN domain-containing protein n=1 Tax=Amycolatopsis sp. DG1A-15b TaxID=3052846 RepID=UPI003341401A